MREAQDLIKRLLEKRCVTFAQEGCDPELSLALSEHDGYTVEMPDGRLFRVEVRLYAFERVLVYDVDNEDDGPIATTDTYFEEADSVSWL